MAEQKNSMVSVRIDRMFDLDGSNLKATASANIAGAFAVHGIKVMDSEKGLFISMPQSKYQQNGETKYSDIVHPITAEARDELNQAVMVAYGQKLLEEQTQMRDAQRQSTEPTMAQSM